jgi:hypothetical protein
VAYIWHAGTKAGSVQDSLAACGFETRAQTVMFFNFIEHYNIGDPLRPRSVLKNYRELPAGVTTTCGGFAAANRRRSMIGIGSPLASDRNTAASVLLPRPFSA